MAKKKAASKKTTRKKAAVKKKATKQAASKKAVKNPSGSSAALTAEQQKKVRKLLKSKDAGNVKLAISLLKSTAATTNDWNEVFSTAILSQLVNTWDVDVWNVVAAGFQEQKSLQNDFGDLVGERFGRLSETKQALFLKAIKHKGDLDLYGLTSLSAVAAESLSKHKGRLLLNGLKSLSDAAAESLSKHKGRLLLNGLKSLSDAAAESLSKHKGPLELNGLTSLSDKAAEGLAKHEGSLYLKGLTDLSDATANALSNHNGDVYLDALTSLSDSPGHVALAERLSKHRGCLSLYDLTSLSDAAAESLSKFMGRRLDLSSERQLQVSTARRRLIKRTRQTAAQAQAPSLSADQHKKLRKLLRSKDVSLVRLAISLLESAGAAEADWQSSFTSTIIKRLVNTWDPEVWMLLDNSLQAHQHLIIEFRFLAANTFKALWNYERSRLLETFLSQHEHHLFPLINSCISRINGKQLELNGLKSLSDAAAESVSQHKGSLHLNGLKRLSDAASAYISQHKGKLSLNSLTHLTDAAAESLGQHQGNLYLGGLKSLSDAAAESLSKHKGDLIVATKLKRQIAEAKRQLKKTS